MGCDETFAVIIECLKDVDYFSKYGTKSNAFAK